MAEAKDISINLSTDDLVSLIRATAEGKGGEAQTLVPPEGGPTPTPVQPLWCGIVACGGSVN